jgi:hypothetical protein
VAHTFAPSCSPEVSERRFSASNGTSTLACRRRRGFEQAAKKDDFPKNSRQRFFGIPEKRFDVAENYILSTVKS